MDAIQNRRYVYIFPAIKDPDINLTNLPACNNMKQKVIIFQLFLSMT